MIETVLPVKLYGSKISYYTGKMEAYLRFKEIPYQFKGASPEIIKRLFEKTGTSQIPALELPDGRFLTDTTPTIDFLEELYPCHPVIPSDPVLRFFSKLVEDYADEWLWRPAMHYRWSYKNDRILLSSLIAEEILAGMPYPNWILRQFMKFRQWYYYVYRDGVSADTREHVEGIYLQTLDHLSRIFEVRPFILGDRPSLVDFGFFASMFRHFAHDPTPSRIMRETSPLVFDWQARLWSARGSEVIGMLLDEVPKDWYPILSEIGDAYLPFLNANARAFNEGQSRFEVRIQQVRYRNIPVSRYRVWCLQVLRDRLEALELLARQRVESILQDNNCLKPMMEISNIGSSCYSDIEVPFQGIKVLYQNRS